jgi:DNA-directed RNA polymerase alpha subunit/DNA-directed RNA polymerase subunit L
MDPKISNISEENGVYKFTLSGLNVSLANAVRRTILSEIPVVAIKTDTYESNQCNIEINTTRLHNEILKQRLSCVPICLGPRELELLPGIYQLEIDRQNDTDDMEFITTADFKIKNKANGNYLTRDETKRIFPPNEITKCYIDFARIRPKIGNNIPGERLKLVADFSISNAKDDAKFNAVSNCTYGFTPDMAKVSEQWNEKEKVLKSKDTSTKDIEFHKKNFYILDAQRYYIPNSYDFTIETVGSYENIEIVKQGLAVLTDKFVSMIKNIDADLITINTGETTMDNCYDILLHDEDYTMGKAIEFILYDTHYNGDRTLSFCGFKKFHPHDTKSTVRIAFVEKSDKSMAKQYLREACHTAQLLYIKTHRLF